jgi:dynein heavy chain, axonemal
MEMHEINLCQQTRILRLQQQSRVCLQMIRDMPGPQRTLWIQNLFLIALVWSIGGNTDAGGRDKFNTYLRRLVSNDVPQELAVFATGQPVRINQMFSESKSVYDFVFDKSKSSWQFWLSTVEPKPIDVDAEYSNIVVPTVDTIR